jgi:DNA modification methylase
MDCFGGSGTTGRVALELGRQAILCELNPEYIEIAKQRTTVTPGLPLGNEVAA